MLLQTRDTNQPDYRHAAINMAKWSLLGDLAQLILASTAVGAEYADS